MGWLHLQQDTAICTSGTKARLTRLNSIFFPFWSKTLIGANFIFAPDVLGWSSTSVSIAVGTGRRTCSSLWVFFVTLGILTVAAAPAALMMLPLRCLCLIRIPTADSRLPL